jgi:integrase
MTKPVIPRASAVTAEPTDALTTGLSLAEQRYVTAARAPNTLRGYRSDWAEFTTWCDHQHLEPLPAAPATVSSYLTVLAGYGARVGTMSRRLSSIKFAHRAADLPDPTANARVIAVWEGIRRTHAAPPEQATPLMPPELWDVLEACPATKTWKTRTRPSEPSLAGARDRALLIVGFVAALRRSEISALNIEDIRDHPNGKVLTLPRSKTNQAGEHAELVILPRSANPRRSPVALLQHWLELADITAGPVFRPVTKGNRVLDRRLSADAVNDIVQQAAARAELDDPDQESDVGARGQFSAHSLRAGFVTYAHTRGATDRAIAHQTRHRSLASVGTYVRIHSAWEDNAATELGL